MSERAVLYRDAMHSYLSKYFSSVYEFGFSGLVGGITVSDFDAQNLGTLPKLRGVVHGVLRNDVSTLTINTENLARNSNFSYRPLTATTKSVLEVRTGFSIETNSYLKKTNRGNFRYHEVELANYRHFDEYINRSKYADAIHEISLCDKIMTGKSLSAIYFSYKNDTLRELDEEFLRTQKQYIYMRAIRATWDQ